jgi:predicted nuclease of predicted toxin-antitoxin system
VLTAQELGLSTATDEEHLARATTEGRVLLTQDADFLTLHATGTAHTGVVYARMGTSIGRIVQGTLLIFDVLTPEEMINHVEYL